MTTKKYLKTIEDVLALKDTDTKIYRDNTTGGYYQFIGGVLCHFYSNSTPVFNAGIDVNGDYYILVEEPIKDADENDIGKLCKFWDDDTNEENISVLKGIHESGRYPFFHNAGHYSHCRRLTPEDVAEITGYKVEE